MEKRGKGRRGGPGREMRWEEGGKLRTEKKEKEMSQSREVMKKKCGRNERPNVKMR